MTSYKNRHQIFYNMFYLMSIINKYYKAEYLMEKVGEYLKLKVDKWIVNSFIPPYSCQPASLTAVAVCCLAAAVEGKLEKQKLRISFRIIIIWYTWVWRAQNWSS